MADTPLYICLDATEDDIERSVLNGAARVKMLGARSASELSDDVLEEASVCAVWHTIHVDETLLRRLKRCRAIIRMGVGYDNVDISAAGRLGIRVCNIPDYGTEEVADSAICLTLGLFRGALAGARLLNEPGVTVRGADAIAAAVPYVKRVRDSVLGLVGLGRIGTAVARRATACGFTVIFFDPYVPDGADKAIGIRRAKSLEALLAESDCISLHCNCASADVTGRAAARAMPARSINAAAFACMRPGCFLVNTARGELVDEVALAAALASGQVAAAALDVHASEPFEKGSGPLGSAPNLYCCAHQAWYSPESRAEMRRKGAEAARRAVLSPKDLRNVVNAQHLVEQPRARL